MLGLPRKSNKGEQAERVWQRMLSGRRLDIADPSPFDVEIEDIAHGLARVARWNGQTTGDHAFSVAQHSLVVLHVLDALHDNAASPELRLTTLLHDAPEYVIGDMISPFKAFLGESYRTIEDRLATAIHLRHQLPPSVGESHHKTIKQADRISAYLEAVQLAGFTAHEAGDLFGVPRADLIDMRLVPLSAIEAEEAFLNAHAEAFEAHLEAIAESPAAHVRHR
ncbi:MAG: HD family hydrolase [Pseudomonadota bacterium]